MISIEVFVFGLLGALMVGILCGYLFWGSGRRGSDGYWDAVRETWRLRALRSLKEEQRLLEEEGTTDES